MTTDMIIVTCCTLKSFARVKSSNNEIENLPSVYGHTSGVQIPYLR